MYNVKRSLIILAMLHTVTTNASNTVINAKQGNIANATLSECIAETSVKSDLLECVKNRNSDVDTDEDHKVLKCLINGDDTKPFWFEDCIHG